MNLQQAGDVKLETHGVVRAPALHSAKVILPTKGVVAEVTQNLLCAHAYLGPSGPFSSGADTKSNAISRSSSSST